MDQIAQRLVEGGIVADFATAKTIVELYVLHEKADKSAFYMKTALLLSARIKSIMAS